MIDLYKDSPVVGVIFTAIILFIILFCIDLFGSLTFTETGQIVAKGFSASTESTGVGVGMTRNGAVPVVTHSGHPDEWSVIVRTGDEFIKIECSVSEYYKHTIGDEVKINRYLGRFTGINYSNRLK